MDSTRCSKSVVKSSLKFGEVDFSREILAMPEEWITAILLGFMDAVRKNSWEMQQNCESEFIVIVHRVLSEWWWRCCSLDCLFQSSVIGFIFFVKVKLYFHFIFIDCLFALFSLVYLPFF